MIEENYIFELGVQKKEERKKKKLGVQLGEKKPEMGRSPTQIDIAVVGCQITFELKFFIRVFEPYGSLRNIVSQLRLSKP